MLDEVARECVGEIAACGVATDDDVLRREAGDIHEVGVTRERVQERGGEGGLEALMRDVGDVSAWCACAGIPMLSVYEPSGTFFFSSFRRKKNHTGGNVYVC